MPPRSSNRTPCSPVSATASAGFTTTSNRSARRCSREVQGLTGFKQPDPLLHRTFGAVITADKGERLDDLRLRSPRGKSHRFSVFVLTRHPATPEQWLADMDDTIRRVEAQDFAGRRQAHERWWSEFWNRSWIRASANADVQAVARQSIVPTNAHPVRIGMDQGGGNKFAGELGRVSMFGEAAARGGDRRPLATLATADPLAGKPEAAVLRRRPWHR